MIFKKHNTYGYNDLDCSNINRVLRLNERKYKLIDQRREEQECRDIIHWRVANRYLR